MHGFDPSAGKEPINYGFASVSFELKKSLTNFTDTKVISMRIQNRNMSSNIIYKVFLENVSYFHVVSNQPSFLQTLYMLLLSTFGR